MTVKDILIEADPDIEIRIETVFGKVLFEHTPECKIGYDNPLFSTVVSGITIDGNTLVIISSTKYPKAHITNVKGE